ncbi:hypothetical protein NFI96_007634 [Prochilodus magdalenae]|nr:hypothetical protein NFI96_007634 [Prochilodus magdalenae]
MDSFIRAEQTTAHLDRSPRLELRQELIPEELVQRERLRQGHRDRPSQAQELVTWQTQGKWDRGQGEGLPTGLKRILAPPSNLAIPHSQWVSSNGHLNLSYLPDENLNEPPQEEFRPQSKNRKKKKDESKEPMKAVGFFQLFRYATCLEVCLMLIGLLCAALHGIALPLMCVVFGQMTDSFVLSGQQINITGNFTPNSTDCPTIPGIDIESSMTEPHEALDPSCQQGSVQAAGGCSIPLARGVHVNTSSQIPPVTIIKHPWASTALSLWTYTTNELLDQVYSFPLPETSSDRTAAGLGRPQAHDVLNHLHQKRDSSLKMARCHSESLHDCLVRHCCWSVFGDGDVVLRTVMVTVGVHVVLGGAAVHRWCWHYQDDSWRTVIMAVGPLRPSPWHAYYFVGLGAGVLLLGTFQVMLFLLTATRQTKRIREKYFHAVLHQQMAWFDTHPIGELNTRLTDDINTINDGLGDKIAIFVQFFCTFIAGFVIGFIYGWKLTLVILAVSPLLAGSAAVWSKILATLTSKELSAYAKAGAVAEEILVAIRTVVAFNGQKKAVQKYEDNLINAKNFGVKKAVTTNISMGLTQFIIFGAYALAFWYGTKLSVDEPENYSIGRVLTISSGTVCRASWNGFPWRAAAAKPYITKRSAECGTQWCKAPPLDSRAVEACSLE